MRVLIIAGAFAIGAAGPVSIELPDAFVPFADISGGVSAEAINGNCLSCHSADMVLNQPTLSAAEWRSVVSKMRTTYKAPVDAADDAAIVAWLTAMQARRLAEASPSKG